MDLSSIINSDDSSDFQTSAPTELAEWHLRVDQRRMEVQIRRSYLSSDDHRLASLLLHLKFPTTEIAQMLNRPYATIYSLRRRLQQ